MPNTVGWKVERIREKERIWRDWTLQQWASTSSVTTSSGNITITATATNSATTGAGGVATWAMWNNEYVAAINHALEYRLLREQERNETWHGWTNQYQQRPQYITQTRVVETPAQAAQRRKDQDQYYREQAAAAERARIATAEAKEKAEKLLQSALSPQQKEELKSKGFFHCRSRIGVVYRIYRGSHGNVKKVVNGKEVESLCVQPSYVPDGDCMLAQKLHIENDEEGFRRTANIRYLN